MTAVTCERSRKCRGFPRLPRRRPISGQSKDGMNDAGRRASCDHGGDAAHGGDRSLGEVVRAPDGGVCARSDLSGLGSLREEDQEAEAPGRPPGTVLDGSARCRGAAGAADRRFGLACGGRGGAGFVPRLDRGKDRHIFCLSSGGNEQLGDRTSRLPSDMASGRI